LSSTRVRALQKEAFSMGRKGLLIVMGQVKPEDEEAFNKWYNVQHLLLHDVRGGKWAPMSRT
jgi:hypothetical protein